MKTLALALSVLLSLPLVAVADATIETEASSGGFRGMGASESKTTRRVSGTKAREEANTRFTGAVLGRLGGKKGKDSVHILRVDLDKRWDLNLKKKTYTEGPLVAPPSKDDDEPSEDSAPEKKEKEEKPTHRIKSAAAGVKKTGDTKTINGFKTAKHAASLVVVVEEIATKQTAEYTMTSDIWATPWTSDLRKAMDEETKFQKAYLKKLGVDLSAQDQRRFGLDTARLMLAAAGPEIEKALVKLAREMSAIDGYPIVTETAWRSPAPGEAAKGESADEEEESELSGAEGADSIGGAAMGFLGGMAKNAAKKKVKQAATPDAGKPAISIRTEVKAIDTAKIPDATFEIPVGFKKKG